MDPSMKQRIKQQQQQQLISINTLSAKIKAYNNFINDEDQLSKEEERRISKNSNEKKSFNESEAKNNFYFVCFPHLLELLDSERMKWREYNIENEREKKKKKESKKI